MGFCTLTKDKRYNNAGNVLSQEVILEYHSTSKVFKNLIPLDIDCLCTE